MLLRVVSTEKQEPRSDGQDIQIVMHHVQEFVNWWCDILGIVDPVSVQIASAIVAGGSLLLLRCAR